MESISIRVLGDWGNTSSHQRDTVTLTISDANSTHLDVCHINVFSFSFVLFVCLMFVLLSFEAGALYVTTALAVLDSLSRLGCPHLPACAGIKGMSRHHIQPSFCFFNGVLQCSSGMFWNMLCRSGWPQSERSACLSCPGTGLKVYPANWASSLPPGSPIWSQQLPGPGSAPPFQALASLESHCHCLCVLMRSMWAE